MNIFFRNICNCRFMTKAQLKNVSENVQAYKWISTSIYIQILKKWNKLVKFRIFCKNMKEIWKISGTSTFSQNQKLNKKELHNRTLTINKKEKRTKIPPTSVLLQFLKPFEKKSFFLLAQILKIRKNILLHTFLQCIAM